MKKFFFTLEAVAKYKATVEKKQKADLARVMTRLNRLYEERDLVLQALADNAASIRLTQEKQQNMVRELIRHDNYQTYLLEWQDDVRELILSAEAEKKRIQALLIVTMKEIKTLDRLRLEQYQAYLAEVRQEENLVIGDIIAFRAMHNA
jgi:hypothetical protein